jgi:hypothetical protein
MFCGKCSWALTFEDVRQSKLPVAQQRNYKNSIDCIYRIAKEEVIFCFTSSLAMR